MADEETTDKSSTPPLAVQISRDIPDQPPVPTESQLEKATFSGSTLTNESIAVDGTSVLDGSALILPSSIPNEENNQIFLGSPSYCTKLGRADNETANCCIKKVKIDWSYSSRKKWLC